MDNSLLRVAEVNSVRSAGPSMRNIGSAIAIEIAQREAIRRALSVAELDRRKPGSVAAVEEDGRTGGHITDHNVRPIIEVQITRGQSIGHPRPVLKSEPFPKVALSVIEVHDHQRRSLIADDKILIAVTIEVRGRPHTRGGAGRSERQGSREACLAIIEVDPALAAVTFGNGKVDVAIVIEIGRDDAGGGSRGYRETRRREGSCAVVQTDEAWSGTIGGDDVGRSVTIEVGSRRVSRRPLRSSPRSRRSKVRLPVIEVDHLRVRPVVAGDDIHIAVAI